MSPGARFNWSAMGAPVGQINCIDWQPGGAGVFAVVTSTRAACAAVRLFDPQHTCGWCLVEAEKSAACTCGPSPTHASFCEFGGAL